MIFMRVDMVHEQRSVLNSSYIWLDRIRYRVTFGVIFCVIIPVLFRQYIFDVSIFSPTQYNTAIGGLFAILLGYIGYRRLHVFPGIASGGYIITSFTIMFGMLSLILIFFRIDYSRGQFLVSYLLSIAFFAFLHFKIDNHKRLVFGIVPGGATDRLDRIDNVVWHQLEQFPGPVSKIDGVVADLNHDHSDEWDVRIADLVLQGVPVYHVKQAVEQLTGRVEVEALSENTLGSINPNDVFLKTKTIIDVILATIGIILLAVPMILVALVIKIDSPGPALFRQIRVGFRAKPFLVYKFRTMRHAAPAAPSSARNAAITLDNDPRITRLGRFLRRSRLDELPQLFNIIKGDMSLIGPRPEALALSEWYATELPFYHYRHIIKPGVTGWAQINQGHVADVADVREKLHYDFYYVKNYSVWLDILIMIRTAQTMLTGKGAK
jgi:lipopolysaccharide/colanic/teichoic acid biosynthesis glycosyltransferase